MNEATAFLHALAQALSANTLYTPGHPATRRSLDNLWQFVSALLAVDPRPVFLFLGTAPVYAGRALHDLREWQHSGRLAAAGVQRLEFDDTLTREALGVLVERLAHRLGAGAGDSDGGPAIPGVAFGSVVVAEASEASVAEAVERVDEIEALLQVDLIDELDAMQYILAEATRGAVAREEADALVRILAALLDSHRNPLVNISRSPERYSFVHPVNTALLAMACAAVDGIDGAERQRIGLAALLHDVGMARLPAELSNKQELSDAERGIVETHPALGSALLLSAGGRGFELAALVSLEHHWRPDGQGYPATRFAVEPHWASQLVACCAAFTALRAPRAFRSGWSLERVTNHLIDGAGVLFAPEAVRLLLSAVRPA